MSEGSNSTPPHSRSRGLAERSIRASAWLAGGTGIVAVLRLIVLGVLARLLEPADFGLVAAALLITAFVQIVIGAGLGPVLIQLPDLRDRHVRTVLAIGVVLATVLTATINWGAAPIAAAIFDIAELPSILAGISWIVPFRSISVIPEALLERELRFRAVSRIDVTGYTLGFAAVSISCAYAGFGVWSLVWGHLATAVLRCGLLLYAHPLPVGRPDLQSLREILGLAGGFTLGRFANFAALSGDTWIVGRVLSERALGLYKYAYELATFPAALIGTVLDRVMFPALARVQDKPEQLAKAFRAALALILLALGPLSAVMIVCAEPLVRIILGEAWLAIVPPFQVLSGIAVLRGAQKLSDSVARATGAVYRRSWRQAIYAASVIAGAWFGARYGILEVAAGVAVAVVISYALMLSLVLGLTGLSWTQLIATFLRALPATALAAAAAGVALPYLSGASALVQVMVPGLLAAVISFATALAMPRTLIGRDGQRAVRLVLRSVGPGGARLANSTLVRRIAGSATGVVDPL